MLLHGSGDEEIAFVYEAEGARGKQRRVKRKHPFEGIMPNLERRYRETDSAAVREELDALPERASPAPTATARACAREARNVFLVDADGDAAREPILRVEHFTLRESLDYFERAEAAGREGRDRRQGRARDRLAPASS